MKDSSCFEGSEQEQLKRLYREWQIDMAFHSNKMEGNQLTYNQVKYLFDEETVFIEKEQSVSLNDMYEITNHFDALNFIFNLADNDLDIHTIKQLHSLLRRKTDDERKPFTPIGEFKIRPNVIGVRDSVPTTNPLQVEFELQKLIEPYVKKENIVFEDIVDFHVKFERIHPFADGNGRVDRLIVFKECLKNNIVPSILLNHHRQFYIMGLKEYGVSRERLLDTFRAGQDYCKEVLAKTAFSGEISDIAKQLNRNRDYEM